MSIRRRMMMGGMKGKKVPTNQIWYTTNDGNKIDFTLSGLTMLSNAFDGEKWVAEFDGVVTTIGEDAFSSCGSLTSVTIPDSVTSIGVGAFYYCSSLASVTIPDSVTSIGNGAFGGCSSLASVTIPDSVTTIGSNAFAECTALASVTIPDSVTSIAYDAFDGVLNIIYHGTASGSPWMAKCVNGYFEGVLLYTDSSKKELVACADKSITSVTIPDSVTTIDYGAFVGCTALTSVTIGNSVTSIGWAAFGGCTALTSVTIGNSVTRIEDYAFNYCTALTSVTIPDSVTSIGSNAFQNVPHIEYHGTATGSPWGAQSMN